MTEPPQPPVPVPAATVVLLRPGPAGVKVLLTRRPASMAFAADMDVFPGGRVDPGDADARLAERSRDAERAAAALGFNVSVVDALALHHAAIRELLEEAGILLARGHVDPAETELARERLLAGASLADAFGDSSPQHVALATDQLVPIAHWTTPGFMPRRFSTWFFAADLPVGVEPTFRDAEVVSHRWITPAAALDELAGRASTMWVPTSSVLQQLAASRASSAAELANTIGFGRVEPPRISSDATGVTRVESWCFGGVPGRRGAASILGKRSVIVVDPGDPSPDAIAAIESDVRRRGASTAAIVLTAADPDRAAGAEALAIPARAPVLVAPGAGRHLPYDTVELGDGERVPADLDVRVRLGPAGSGRLELMPSGRQRGSDAPRFRM